MELETSTIMLVFFLFLLTLSIWKIWAFLPNEQLADDDRTEESQKELTHLMLKIIKDYKGEISASDLFLAMKKDEEFNSQLFWRFNLNRLIHLIKEHSSDGSIKSIYKENSR